MKIFEVTDAEFKQFGRVLSLDTAEIVMVGEEQEMPAEGSKYVPTLDAFEKLPIQKVIEDRCFGGVPAQIGYCWGHNDTLNALEWHTCSEINIAVRDLILLLGDVRDIDSNFRFDSAKIKAFRLRRGQAIEVFATTLHFCPIETEPAGFGCVVGLGKGTNTPIERDAKNPILWARNKWLLAHEDNTELVKKGAFAGIYGENYQL